MALRATVICVLAVVALAGVFASTAYKEYPLVPEAEVKAWKKHKEEMDSAEKELNKFLTEQSARLAERSGSRIAAYMIATVEPAAGTVHQGSIIPQHEGNDGDTGGQARPALYFEIRANGEPVNPAVGSSVWPSVPLRAAAPRSGARAPSALRATTQTP
jgi:hypothetical protein